MTALSIVRDAAAWLAMDQPDSLFPASDVHVQTIQLRSLLNEELVELRKWPNCYWRKLIRQHTFVTVNADTQTSTPLPTDLDYMIPQTMWDRTMARPCIGPLSPQDWQAWMAQPILTAWAWGFRLRGNDFLTAPEPPAGDTAAYEYISTFAVYSLTDPVTVIPDKPLFTADTDTCIFDETMMSRGVRWRFLRAKGLSYAEEYREWSYLVQREVARSKAMPVLNTAGRQWGLPFPYTPSQNFPAPA